MKRIKVGYLSFFFDQAVAQCKQLVWFTVYLIRCQGTILNPLTRIRYNMFSNKVYMPKSPLSAIITHPFLYYCLPFALQMLPLGTSLPNHCVRERSWPMPWPRYEFSGPMYPMRVRKKKTFL